MPDTCSCASTHTCSRSAPAATSPTCSSTPTTVGAEVVHVDRGGDITYHGPGQLVGYPIVNVAGRRGGGMADTAAHVAAVEQVVIDALAAAGPAPAAAASPTSRVSGSSPDGPTPRKIAAVGVRLARGRSMHGFALNVDPDMAFFDAIVPCGIDGKPVTSTAWRRHRRRHAGRRATPSPRSPPAAGAVRGSTRHDVAWRHRPEDLSAFSRGEGPGSRAPVRRPTRPPTPAAPDAGVSVRLRGRLAEAGVGGGLDIGDRKPEWMRVKADMGPEYRRIKSVMRDLDLVTVCEEAGCPNIFDCWNDGTATFMILGERCTRACGFCLVDTRKPEAVDHDEPARVADAVEQMGLRHAVVTMVARDDLADGGAAAVAATIEAIRSRCPDTRVEVLISDLRGDADALDVVIAARPDVLNHNIETVPRLQRAVRPSAGYARSLAVLARGEAGRADHQDVDHRRDGRTPRRGRGHARPTSPPSAPTSSPSASTCGPRPTTSRSTGGGIPTSSRRSPPRARRWASATSRPDR